MENLILKVLSFDVAVPTINCFCDWFLKRIGADEETSSLAMVCKIFVFSRKPSIELPIDFEVAICTSYFMHSPMEIIKFYCPAKHIQSPGM